MRKIYITILLIIISTTLLFTGNTYASTDSILLKLSKTEVKQNETFTVIVSAKSSDSIDGLSANVQYDNNVLEVISTDLVDSKNWADLGEFPEIFATWKTTTSEETTSADIYKITFKVKEGIDAKDTQIKLTSINLSVGTEINSLDDVIETIKITQNSGNQEGNNGSQEEGDTDGEGEVDPGQEGDTDGKGEVDPGQEGDTDGEGEVDPGQEGDTDGEGEIDPGQEGDTDGEGEVNPEQEESGKDETEDTKETTDNIKKVAEKSGDETTSYKSLPFAGNLKAVIISIIAFSIYGAIGYILYKKYKNI